MTQEQLLTQFEEITEKMIETARKKNSDYTGDNSDAFKNFTAVEHLGAATTEQGFYTRMTDKMMRLAGYIQNGTLQVEDEKITDTLQDLAVYCILFNIYLHGKN